MSTNGILTVVQGATIAGGLGGAGLGGAGIASGLGGAGLGGGGTLSQLPVTGGNTLFSALFLTVIVSAVLVVGLRLVRIYLCSRSV